MKQPDIGNVEINSFGYKQELNRTLGLRDLTIYGIIFMAPLAPFQVYAMVAQQSFGMSALVYIVGVLAMLFTAFSYRSMASEFPIAGSVFSYIQRSMNPHVGFVTGWLLLADYTLIPALLYSMCCVWMTGIFPTIPATVWAILFIIINTYINIRGITVTAKANFIMFIIEMALIAALLVIAIKFVFISGLGTGGFTLDPFYQADNFTWELIPAAATIAVLGFIGFDGISTLSEEAINPRKNIGKATILSILFIGGFFILQAYIAYSIYPNYMNLDPEMGYFEIVREAGGQAFYIICILVNVFAIGGAVNLSCQAASSRVLFSMSRDDLLPFSSIFKKVHPKYQTPVNATYLSGIICVVSVLTLSIQTVIQFVNFGALTSFMMLNLGVIYYFYIKKKERGLRAFILYLVMPFCGFGIIAFVWSGFDNLTFIVGFSWLLLGVIIGAIKSKGYKEIPPALKGLD